MMIEELKWHNRLLDSLPTEKDGLSNAHQRESGRLRVREFRICYNAYVGGCMEQYGLEKGETIARDWIVKQYSDELLDKIYDSLNFEELARKRDRKVERRREELAKRKEKVFKKKEDPAKEQKDAP